MRVLIGCERFGKVRDAFRARGHDAWSCDLAPDVNHSPYHIQGNVLGVLHGTPIEYGHNDQVGMFAKTDSKPWDLAIFHPDCTYLTNSAEWAYGDGPYHQKVKPGTLVGAERRQARRDAVAFIEKLRAAPIPRKAFENPVGHLSSAWRKPDQTIQPHQFGDDASKATCLWLENLPALTPTKHIPPRIVNGKPRWANQTDGGQNKLPPTAERAMLRAATYSGIADAFADQWGGEPTTLQFAMPFISRAIETARGLVVTSQEHQT